jgi:hypothetical protein
MTIRPGPDCRLIAPGQPVAVMFHMKHQALADAAVWCDHTTQGGQCFP